MIKKIFIINGPATSGKDTFVSMVSAIVPSMNYSSVELVKEAALLLGWTGGKEDKDRKFLSDLKELTSNYSTAIRDSMRKKADDFYSNDIHNFLFFHIREPKEIKRMAWEFNAKTILVLRYGILPNQSNFADANVLNYDYDIIINNNGTLGDLKEEARRFADEYFTGAAE